MATLWGSSAWAETYYAEQYSEGSSTTGWTSSTAGRFTPVILEENGNYFLSVNQDQRNNNGCTVTGTVLAGTVAAGSDFTLTFDMRLSNANNQEPVSVEFKDAANEGVIFSLTATGKNASTWKINGTSTEVGLLNSGAGKNVADITWCSYKISRSGNLTYLTITNGNEEIFSQSIITGASETGGLGNIVFTTKRYSANFAIDNIEVRDLEDGDVPASVSTSYSVVCRDATGAEIASYSIPTIAGIEVNGDEYAKDFTKDGQKYIYVDGNKTITTQETATSNVITLNFRTAENWTYTAKAVKSDDSQDITTLATGQVAEGDAASFIYPYYLNVRGTLYNKLENNKNFLYSFTPQTNNTTESLTYDATQISNVVFFAEAEDIKTLEAVTSSYLPERFSAGRGAYASEEAKKIVTLPAGVYKLTAQLMGTASVCTFTFTAGNETIWTNATSNQSFYVGPGITGEEFTLTQETDIMLQPGGGDGSSSRVTNSVDFIYIQRTGDYVPSVTYYTLTTGMTPDAAAGSITSEQLNDEGKYEEGTKITLTATANEGYKFKQWINGDVTTNVEVLSTDNPYTITMDKNYNVVAQFVKTYRLTVETNGNGVVDTNPFVEDYIYEEGTQVRLTVLPIDLYDFESWVEVAADGTETPIDATENHTVTMNKDLHLKAYIVKCRFTVDVSCNQAEGMVSKTEDETGTYYTNTPVTVTATPAEGYEFLNWAKASATGDEVVSTENPYTFNAVEDIALVANFQKKAAEPVDNNKVIYYWTEGTEQANSITLAEGVTVAITGNADKKIQNGLAITVDGKEYTSMKVSNSAQNTLTLPKKAKAVTFYSYINKASDAENLRTSYWKEVNGVNYTAETAAPMSCYSDGDRTKPDVRTFTFDEPTAEFTFTNTGEQLCYIIEVEYAPSTDKPTYTLTLTCDETQGSITVDPKAEGNVYEENTQVTLTAVPADNYQFASWFEVSVDGTETPINAPANYTVTMTKDIHLKATFEQKAAEPTDDGVIFFADVTATENIAFGPGETAITTAMANITGGSMTAISQQDAEKNLIGKQSSNFYFCLTNNNTFFKVVLNKALAAGDVISANTYTRTDTGLGLFVSASDSRPSECTTKLSIDATETASAQPFSTYTVEAGDGLVGATTIYIYRETAKSTYFDEFKIARSSSGTEPQEIVAGDANLDGVVTVSDAVLAVSFAIETVTPTAAQFQATDLDKNQTIDVQDVMAIVDIILPDESTGVRSAGSTNNYMTLSGADISLSNTTAFAGFQMDVTLAEGAQLNGVQLSERASDLSVAYNRVADNTYRIVAVSFDKKTVNAGNGTLLSLDISGNSDYSLGDIKFVDTKANAYAVGLGHATGISRVGYAAEGTDVYTVGGVKSSKFTKGLNVIRNANGEVKKVYVK